MEWWILIVSYGLLGGGIKYIDQAYDIGVFNRGKAVFLGAVLGILMGTIAAYDAISAMIFLSFIIFALITRKIDNPAFYIGAFMVFFIAAVMTIVDSANYEINWLILSVLIFAGWVDEEGNRLADQRKFDGFISAFFDYRSFMKIVVLLLAVFSIIPIIYFFAFMTYDLSYLGVGIYSKTLLNKHNVKKVKWLQERKAF